jgi:hypothetical protein
VLRRIFGLLKEEVTEGIKKLHYDELHHYEIISEW